MLPPKARLKFSEETQNLSDDELKTYCFISEILSDMFINFIKKPKELKLDNATRN